MTTNRTEMLPPSTTNIQQRLRQQGGLMCYVPMMCQASFLPNAHNHSKRSQLENVTAIKRHVTWCLGRLWNPRASMPITVPHIHCWTTIAQGCESTFEGSTNDTSLAKLPHSFLYTTSPLFRALMIRARAMKIAMLRFNRVNQFGPEKCSCTSGEHTTHTETCAMLCKRKTAVQRPSAWVRFRRIHARAHAHTHMHA